MAGVSKEKQIQYKKACQEFYDGYKTISFTAQHLGIDKDTVQRYFKEFSNMELNEIDESFLKKQKITKDRILYKLDSLIFKSEEQLKKLEIMIDIENKDADIEILESPPDRTRIETLINKIHGDLIKWNQEKAGIEDSPTLDVKIGQLLEDRVNELDSRETKLNELEQKLKNSNRK